MDVNQSWEDPFGDEQVEIDLREDNLSKLKDSLSPYFSTGRPVDHRAKQPTLRRIAPSRATHDDAMISA